MSDFYGFNIGDTPLFESPELSARYRIHVWIKDESKNTVSRTVKDRRNAWVLEYDNLIESPIYYVQITYGNSGNSLGQMTEAIRIATGKEIYVVNIVPKDISIKTKRVLSKYGPVIKMDLSKKIIHWHELIDIAEKNVGNKNGVYRIVERIGDGSEGYGNIITEIRNEIEPTHIFDSVGSGECYYSLSKALKGTDINLIGATIKDNVIATEDDFLKDIGSGTADMLGCGYTGFRDLLKQIWDLEDKNSLEVVSEDEINEELSYLNNVLYLDVDPNSVPAFVAAKRMGDTGKLSMNDRAVIIKTAGYKDRLAGLSKYSRLKRYGTAAACLALIFGVSAPFAVKYSRQQKKIKSDREQYSKKILSYINEGEIWTKNQATFLLWKELKKGNIDLDWDAYEALWMSGLSPLDHDIVMASPSMRKDYDEYTEWLQQLEKNRKLKRQNIVDFYNRGSNDRFATVDVNTENVDINDINDGKLDIEEPKKPITQPESTGSQE